jgi:hypothetical protein
VQLEAAFDRWLIQFVDWDAGTPSEVLRRGDTGY